MVLDMKESKGRIEGVEAGPFFLRACNYEKRKQKKKKKKKKKSPWLRG
jgi:hypothetical protein